MDDSRPITHAEIQFFSKSGTGKGEDSMRSMGNVLMDHLVPVIVVFTKCEVLEVEATRILQETRHLNFGDAARLAPQYARENMWNIHLELEKYKYRPQSYVYLQGK